MNVLSDDEGLPLSFYFISLSSFLFQLTRFVVQPIYTLYLLDVGASLVQAGFILSIQNFLLIVSKIPMTMISRKIGEDRMFKIAFIVQATTAIFYAMTPSPIWLYVIPFYQIIATGSFNQMAMSRASNMAPTSRQGDALGRYMTFMSSGMFIGPLISSGLLVFLDYRQLFLVTSIFPLIAFILFTRFMPKPGDNLELPEEPEHALGSLRSVLADRNIQVLSLIRTTYSLSNTMFTALFAVYATQTLGFSESRAALLFSIMGFTNAMVKLPAGYIGDRFDAKKVLFGTFTALILVFVSVAYSSGFTALAVTLFLFGVCWGTRAVNEWATLAKTVDPANKPIAMSYMSSIWGLGATLGSIMAGYLAETVSFQTIFLISAAINLPALPAILLLEKTDEQKVIVEEKVHED
ncbi:MFS transporter [Candidatus Bathyarchaeota archaeon]|nr:MFS transporter [Candidatus Bathyarchaeota archaeon]